MSNNNMKELIVWMADCTPEALIIEELQKCLEIYKEGKHEKDKVRLDLLCCILLTKFEVEKDGSKNFLEKMNRINKGYDMLNFKKQ